MVDPTHPLSQVPLSEDPHRRQRQRNLLHQVVRGLPPPSGMTERLPLDGEVAGLFGEGGLPLGSTVVVRGQQGQGLLTLALAVLARMSRETGYLGIVNLARVGLLSASELGVDLARLIVIARPVPQVARVASILLEGCTAVLLGDERHLEGADAERLQRRARERAAVLFVLDPNDRARRWREVPDVTLTVTHSRTRGLGDGAGRLLARELSITTHHRRRPPQHTPQMILLPPLVAPEIALPTDGVTRFHRAG